MKNGARLGGFTTKQWEDSAELKHKKDEQAFVFSIELNQKFEIKPAYSSKSVTMKEDRGPIFGYPEFFGFEVSQLLNSPNAFFHN